MSEIWRGRGSRRLEDLIRNLRFLENELASVGSRSRAALNRTAEETTDNFATRLSALADQIRGGAASASDQVVRYGGQAARRGEDGLQLLADETINRPLPSLAVAVGFGVLVGILLCSKRS
jgi:hypothetical protein